MSKIRVLEVVDRVTRSGPSMAVGFVRFAIRRIAVMLYFGAVLGVITGGMAGDVAESPAEAQVSETIPDIDIRETERVDRPLVPDRLEQPAEPSNEPPDWYLDNVQKLIDVMLAMTRAIGDVTAQFVFANQWAFVVTQVVGLVGVLGPLGYHFVRMSRVKI